MSEAELRASIRAALRSLDEAVQAAIRRELATPIDLGHSGRLQFEVCPYFYGTHLVQTEETILPDSAVPDAMPQQLQDAAEEADLDFHAALGEELFPWFAERWLAAGGPRLYRPAYAFFHGGLDEPRYDLEQRRWCEVEEVWPEAGPA
jgi:hypothetical protein